MNAQQIGTLRDVVDRLTDQDGRQIGRFRKFLRFGQVVREKAGECPVLTFIADEMAREAVAGEADETQGDLPDHKLLHEIVEAMAASLKRKTA